MPVSKPYVAIPTGSDSMSGCIGTPGIGREVNVWSARRTLAGTVAALTVMPVTGVPMEGGPLTGQDALPAAQTLAPPDSTLAKRLVDDRATGAAAAPGTNEAAHRQFSK